MKLSIKIMTIAAIITTLASCTFSYDPNSPGYKETRYEPLQSGTYVKDDGRYTYIMQIQTASEHSTPSTMLLSVYMEDLTGDNLVLIGAFEGRIEHDRLSYDNLPGGWSERKHEDEFIFTSYEGSSFIHDAEDLSGTYAITYRGGKDISSSDYGHVYIPVAGTRVYIEDADDLYDDYEWGGMLKGTWEMQP